MDSEPLDVAKRHQKFARYHSISLSRPIMRANIGSEILSGSFKFYDKYNTSWCRFATSKICARPPNFTLAPNYARKYRFWNPIGQFCFQKVYSFENTNNFCAYSSPRTISNNSVYSRSGPIPHPLPVNREGELKCTNSFILFSKLRYK